MANDQGSAPTRMPAKRSQPASNVRELYQQGDEAREQIMELAGAFRRLAQDTSSLLRERMKTQPYGTLAAVAGVGYVLGGGLSPSALRLLFFAGSRVAFQAFMQRLAPNQQESVS